MRKTTIQTLVAAAALFGAGVYQNFGQGVGQVMVMRYTNITGSQVRNLVIDAKFPNSPDLIYYTNVLSLPVNSADNYGQWLIGFLVPTNTGWYRIAITTDDAGLFLMSSNESPAHLQVRCFTGGSSGTANYNNAGHRMQQSPAIYMVAGQHYYFEALHKEGTGGDGGRIGWIELVPGGATNVPNSNLGIAGTFLKTAINPGPVSFYRPPSNLTVQSGGTAIFEVQFDGDAPFEYEWVVNDVPQGLRKSFVPRDTLALPGVTAANDGTTVKVAATNRGGTSSAVSSTAVLSVVADTQPPAVVEAVGSMANPNTIRLRYSEPVDPTAATDAFNYNFSTGTGIAAAQFDPTDPSVIVLTTDPAPVVTDGATLRVTSISDLNGNGANNLTIAVVINQGTVRHQRFTGFGGATINDLISNAAYPYAPTLVNFLTQFDIGSALGDTYGTRIQGYLRVGRTGWYRFAFSSDDQGVVYVSSDDQPTNKVMVAGCAHSEGYLNYNNHRMSQSAPIHLAAGRSYYIEALHKENTGGDDLAVALQYVSTVQTQHITYNINGPIPNNTPPIQSYYLNPYNEAVALDPAYPSDVASERCPDAIILSIRLLTGSPALSYQWHDAVSGSPIPDATNTTYAVPLPASSASYYCLVANDVNTVQSRTAVVTIPVYTNGLALLSAGTLDGRTIGLQFDRRLDPVTAEDEFNYAVLDPATGFPLATVDSAVMVEYTPAPMGRNLPGHAKVILGLQTVVTPPFKVRVSGVKDCLSGVVDPAASEYLVADVGMAYADINIQSASPAPNYTNLPLSAKSYDVVSGGLDIWNQGDEFHFIYKPITGDFDIRVNIPRLDRSDPWSKAGLMARLDLQTNSRMLYVTVSQVNTPGEVLISNGKRDTTTSGGSNWEPLGRPTFPQALAWVRLKRLGNTFISYYSTNGAYWVSNGNHAPNPAYPATVLVGMCTTSHTRSQNAAAYYREFGDTFYPGAAISIAQQPQDVTTPQGTKGVFTVVASVVNAPQSELYYQWQRSDGGGGFTNVPAATLPTLTTPFLTVADDHGAQYRVVLGITGLSVTSSVATVSVATDQARPKLLYALSLNPTSVAVFFSEPMGPSVADPFVWGIDQGVLVGQAAINSSNSTRVDLTLNPITPLTAGTTYRVTNINGADVAGNPIDPTPAIAPFTAYIDYLAGWVNPQSPPGPDNIQILPTDNIRPYGSLALRGFDCWMVQSTNSFPNDMDVAEQILAGAYNSGWPFFLPLQSANTAGQPQFFECRVINYNVDAIQRGRLTPDQPFPGIPNPAHPLPVNITNYFAMEALAYLELRQGLHRFGVNSDDGFRLTPATNATDTATAQILGQFNGGRGAGDSTFDVYAPIDGLYPIRLTWEQGSGAACVEFWTYNLVTGQYVGVNDPNGVHAYRPSGIGVAPPVITGPTLTITQDSANVTICWPELPAIPGDPCPSIQGVLESANSLAAPVHWNNVSGTVVNSGGMNCLVVPMAGVAQFYRLRIAQ